MTMTETSSPERLKATLVGFVRQLAKDRGEKALHELDLATAKADFEREHETTITLIAGLKKSIIGFEGLVREAALALFRVDASSKKLPGVTICEGKRTAYEYDPERALAWAKGKGICLIPESLDKAAFEAICATATKPDFVKAVESTTLITMKIDTDLSKALKEGDDESWTDPA